MPTCDSLVDLLPKGMCRKFDADSALCVQHRVGRTPCVWQQEPGCRRSRDECSVSQKSMPRTRAESSRATAQPLNLTSEFISRDYARAGMLAHALRPRYKAAQPFPHIKVDDLFCRDALTEVAAELPETMDPKRFASRAYSARGSVSTSPVTSIGSLSSTRRGIWGRRPSGCSPFYARRNSFPSSSS